MKKPGAQKKAFTLVEVMVALLLLVFGITSATLFLGSMGRCRKMTEGMTVGVGLAQGQIELLLGQQASAIGGGSTTIDQYSEAWSVDNSTDLQGIDTVISWNDIDGNTRQMSLNTLYAR